MVVSLDVKISSAMRNATRQCSRSLADYAPAVWDQQMRFKGNLHAEQFEERIIAMLLD